jgi:hypothetical protein
MVISVLIGIKHASEAVMLYANFGTKGGWGGMKKNPDPSKRRGHGKENPRYCYGTLNSRYYRVRQLRDETKSCGNQPANISVIDRR